MRKFMLLTAMAVMMLLCVGCRNTDITESTESTVETTEVEEIKADTDEVVDDISEEIAYEYCAKALVVIFGEDIDTDELYEFECNGIDYVVYGDQMVSMDYFEEVMYNMMDNDDVWNEM